MNVPPLPWFAAIIVVLVLALLMLAGTRRAFRTIRCPQSGERRVVRMHETIWGGRPVDIEACSAFSPSTAVTCAKRCLDCAAVEVDRIA